MDIVYTPYVTNIRSIELPELKSPDIPIDKTKPIVKSIVEPITASPLPEYVIEQPVTPQTIVRGTTTFDTHGMNVGNMQSVIDKFNEHGISINVTSGLRPGARTASGNSSYHATGDALDITPGKGETWDTLKTKLKNAPKLVDWLRKNGFGILDETNPEVMKRTGATGPHWHVGKDKSAIEGLQVLLARQGGILKAQQGVMLLDSQPAPYTKQYDLSWNPFKLDEFPAKIENKVENKIEFDNIPGVNMDNLKRIAERLKKEGFSEKQSAAILSTVVAESKANPLAIGDNGKARGLLQWHGNRFNATDDLDSQIDLIINEVKDYKNSNGWLSSKKYNKKDAINAFNGEDLYAMVTALTANFIRPANTDSAIEKRYNQAQQLYDQLIRNVREN